MTDMTREQKGRRAKGYPQRSRVCRDGRYGTKPDHGAVESDRRSISPMNVRVCTIRAAHLTRYCVGCEHWSRIGRWSSHSKKTKKGRK